MLKTTFQKMAAHIETLADGEIEETRAHLLTHALEMAEGHEAGHVRAFANGCDENDYAQSIRPMLMMFTTGKDVEVIRATLLTLFNDGVEAAWDAWPYNDMVSRAREREGLLRFLECKSKTMECRQLVA